MSLTDFGKAVRKARIESGETLVTMAKKLKTTPSFLSALETGRKKIPNDWVLKIDEFFKDAGCPVENLSALADSANGSTVFADSLSLQQKMLVAGFAQSPFTADQLKKISELFDELRKAQEQEGE